MNCWMKFAEAKLLQCCPNAKHDNVETVEIMDYMENKTNAWIVIYKYSVKIAQ